MLCKRVLCQDIPECVVFREPDDFARVVKVLRDLLQQVLHPEAARHVLLITLPLQQWHLRARLTHENHMQSKTRAVSTQAPSAGGGPWAGAL